MISCAHLKTNASCNLYAQQSLYIAPYIAYNNIIKAILSVEEMLNLSQKTHVS